EARVGFTMSHNGYGLDEPVSIERVEIDGEEVQFGETAPLERDCSVVATTEESEAPPAEGACLEHVTATLPSADDLTIAQSAPAPRRTPPPRGPRSATSCAAWPRAHPCVRPSTASGATAAAD